MVLKVLEMRWNIKIFDAKMYGKHKITTCVKQNFASLNNPHNHKTTLFMRVTSEFAQCLATFCDCSGNKNFIS